MCYLSSCYLDLIAMFYSIVTSFLIAFFFAKILKAKKESKYYIFKYFAIIAGTYLVCRLVPILYEYRNLIITFSYLVSVFLLSKDKWYKKIFIVLLFYIFLIIIDIPISMIIFSKNGYSFNEVNTMLDEEYFKLFDLLYSDPRTLALNGLNNVLLTFFGVTTMMIFKKETRHFHIWLICFVISCLSVSNLYFSYLYLDKMVSVIVLIVGQCISISLLIYIIQKLSIYFKYDKSLEENKFLKEKENMQLSYYEMMKDREDVVRKINHDIKNNLQVIYTLDDDVKRKELLDKINSSLDKHYFKKYTSQDILNVVLNIKVKEALNKNIKMNVLVKRKLDFMDDIDVCNLITNILDNAIEAADKSQDRKIDLVIRKKMNYILLECENTFDGKIKLNKKKQLVSLKDGDHGYGTKIIKNIVEKYDGELNYDCLNNLFKLEIMIKITEK